MLDLDGIGRKVFDPAHRVQLIAHDTHIGPLRRQLASGLAQHGLTKAVVLPYQIGALHRLIVLDDLHQRRHAHVGMGIKAEVPEAAALIGQRRVYRRIVQIQHPARRVAAVVLFNRIQQCRRRGRRVALHDDARAVVYGCAQGRQRFFILPLAVIAFNHQRMKTVRQAHAGARIHALGRPQQVAKNGFPRIRKRARKTLHQCQLNGWQRQILRSGKSSPYNPQRRA